FVRIDARCCVQVTGTRYHVVRNCRADSDFYPEYRNALYPLEQSGREHSHLSEQSGREHSCLLEHCGGEHGISYCVLLDVAVIPVPRLSCVWFCFPTYDTCRLLLCPFVTAG
ncbi:unnamed protein product, partial [Laminaria digitata]